MSARQLPRDDEIFLDHIGHFVRDIEAAAEALSVCGFQTTPFAVQASPTGPDGAMEPTGTGNVCAMLRAGYLEFLTKTSDTPLSAELDAAVARWPGVHLAAFAVAKPDETYARLQTSGIDMRPLVHMRRPVETENGASEASFTILRPKPGVMLEGRMQLLTHHTEEQVWQQRWLAQPNGVRGLLGALIFSTDPDEAAARFKKLLGVTPAKSDQGILFSLSRGYIQILPADKAEKTFNIPPGLPWIAAYALHVESLGKIRHYMSEAGIPVAEHGPALIAAFPEALGVGYWLFVQDDRGGPETAPN